MEFTLHKTTVKDLEMEFTLQDNRFSLNSICSFYCTKFTFLVDYSTQNKTSTPTSMNHSLVDLLVVLGLVTCVDDALLGLLELSWLIYLVYLNLLYWFTWPSWTMKCLGYLLDLDERLVDLLDLDEPCLGSSLPIRARSRCWMTRSVVSSLRMSFATESMCQLGRAGLVECTVATLNKKINFWSKML